MSIVTAGIDLAKNIFAIHGVDTAIAYADVVNSRENSFTVKGL